MAPRTSLNTACSPSSLPSHGASTSDVDSTVCLSCGRGCLLGVAFMLQIGERRGERNRIPSPWSSAGGDHVCFSGRHRAVRHRVSIGGDPGIHRQCAPSGGHIDDVPERNGPGCWRCHQLERRRAMGSSRYGAVGDENGLGRTAAVGRRWGVADGRRVAHVWPHFGHRGGARDPNCRAPVRAPCRHHQRMGVFLLQPPNHRGFGQPSGGEGWLHDLSGSQIWRGIRMGQHRWTGISGPPCGIQ